MALAPNISLDGLLAVRHLPNGRVDLLSVDESTRLLANMTSNMSKRSQGSCLSNGSDSFSEDA